MLPIAPAGCLTILIHPFIFSAPSNLQIMPPIVLLSHLSHMIMQVRPHEWLEVGRLSRLMHTVHILAFWTCTVGMLLSKRLWVLCHWQEL